MLRLFNTHALDKETKPEGGGENGGTDGGKTPETGGGDSGGSKPATGGGVKNIENFCKTKPDGTYGDPTNCEYFIQCANSKTFRKKCANGLHWNDKIKNCDFPAKAGCSKQKEEQEFSQQDNGSQAYSKV